MANTGNSHPFGFALPFVSHALQNDFALNNFGLCSQSFLLKVLLSLSPNFWVGK
jgi:hypothetical protein